MKAVADYPILIVTDMEMGYPTSQLPPVPLKSLGACDNPEYYRSTTRSAYENLLRNYEDGAFTEERLNEAVPRMLFGYMMPQSQIHAIEVLAGKLPAKGKLPCKVNLR